MKSFLHRKIAKAEKAALRAAHYAEIARQLAGEAAKGFDDMRNSLSSTGEYQRMQVSRAAYLLGGVKTELDDAIYRLHAAGENSDRDPPKRARPKARRRHA